MLSPVRDPAEILAVYRRDPAVHVYGIADVAQLWYASRWWRRDNAVVGLLDLPGGDVVYAIAADAVAERATLRLLVDLAPRLPDAFVITGPTGLTAALSAARYAATWHDAYDKLHLPAAVPLPSPPPDVATLGHADLPALTGLFATDPDAGDFFHAALVDTGLYLGRWVDGTLAAVAGVHVVDPTSGVAALGNVATHPDHRRRGHALAVVTALLHRLRAEVDVIGLNVRHRTAPARVLYDRLGFTPVLTYEEAAVSRVVP